MSKANKLKKNELSYNGVLIYHTVTLANMALTNKPRIACKLAGINSEIAQRIPLTDG